MTNGEKPSTANDLIEGVINGTVPRQVRLFAAQGMLPVSRDELLRLQLLLSTDRDKELEAIASTSVKETEESKILEILEHHELEPIELDLLIRLREEELIWAKVATSKNVADDTLRVLALHGGETVQDIIITNQVRVLGCLEILEDIRNNEKATTVALRRVREFEEEFIQKVIEVPEEELEELMLPGPEIEPVVDQIKSIDGSIPREDELSLPESEDAELAKQSGEDQNSAFTRILMLDTHGKIMLALKGSREDRAILVNSRNRMVVRAVLSSPKLGDVEVNQYASSRSVSDEVIRLIATNQRWLRKYPTVLALTHNPKTPVRIALQLMYRLNIRDIKQLSRDRNANQVVRVQAQKLYSRRR